MILIHYSDGRVLQGMVLAFGDHVVRVAVKDTDDAAEYRLINHVWVSEDCEMVRMEFADGQDPIPYSHPDPLEAVLEFTTSLQPAPRVM